MFSNVLQMSFTMCSRPTLDRRRRKLHASKTLKHREQTSGSSFEDFLKQEGLLDDVWFPPETLWRHALALADAALVWPPASRDRRDSRSLRTYSGGRPNERERRSAGHDRLVNTAVALVQN